MTVRETACLSDLSCDVPKLKAALLEHVIDATGPTLEGVVLTISLHDQRLDPIDQRELPDGQVLLSTRSNYMNSDLAKICPGQRELPHSSFQQLHDFFLFFFVCFNSFFDIHR